MKKGIKNTIIKITIGLLLFNILIAQTGTSIKAGFTLSSFDKDGFHPVYGIIFGPGYQWSISNELSLAGELLYLNRGGILKRTGVDYSCCYYKNVYQYSLRCLLGYIDIPLLIQYRLPFFNDMEFQIYTGSSFSLSIIDKSKEKDRQDLYSTEVEITEFYPCTDGGCYAEDNVYCSLRNSGISFNFGFKVIWKKYLLDIRYSRDLIGIRRVYCTDLDYIKANALQVMLGIFIPKKIK
jgi:hypothetical protein